MKKEIILLGTLFLCFVLPIHAQKTTAKKTKGYEIKITIKNSKDSMLYLANYYGKNQYLKDSAIADKKTPGVYTFKGDEALQGGIYILASQAKVKMMEFIIDENQHFSFDSDTSDILKNIVVKNCPENVMFFDYIKNITFKQTELNSINSDVKKAETDHNTELANSLKEKLKQKSKEFQDFTLNVIEKNPNFLFSKVLSMNREIEIPSYPKLPDGSVDSTFGWKYYKSNYWMYTDLKDDRLIRTPVFHGKLQRYFETVIVQDNDSIKIEADKILETVRSNEEMFKYVMWWLTNYYETSKIMGHDEIFVYLVEKYYETNQCWWVTPSTLESLNKRATQLKAVLIGAKAPELIMPDTNNVFHSFYQIQKKYTLLWFWDPDCGHCKVETPKLKDFYNKFKDSLNLEVFAVSMDQDLERWKKFIRDNQLTWINVGGNTANIDFHKVYDLYSSPVLYVLDKDKKILAKRIAVADLEDFFQQYQKVLEHRKKMGLDK